MRNKNIKWVERHMAVVNFSVLLSELVMMEAQLQYVKAMNGLCSS